jgi:hypothetical protein
MAVDSEAKRASVLGFGLPKVFVVPDGTIGQDDRQTIAGLYGGILSGSFTGVFYHWNSPYTRVID